jgi:hypothetical protein
MLRYTNTTVSVTGPPLLLIPAKYMIFLLISISKYQSMQSRYAKLKFQFRCGTKISRTTSNSSCSKLLKYASNFLRKQHKNRKNKLLAALGITGTGDIDPKEVILFQIDLIEFQMQWLTLSIS